MRTQSSYKVLGLSTVKDWNSPTLLQSGSYLSTVTFTWPDCDKTAWSSLFSSTEREPLITGHFETVIVESVLIISWPFSAIMKSPTTTTLPNTGYDVAMTSVPLITQVGTRLIGVQKASGVGCCPRHVGLSQSVPFHWGRQLHSPGTEHVPYLHPLRQTANKQVSWAAHLTT